MYDNDAGPWRGPTLLETLIYKYPLPLLWQNTCQNLMNLGKSDAHDVAAPTVYEETGKPNTAFQCAMAARRSRTRPTIRHIYK